MATGAETIFVRAREFVDLVDHAESPTLDQLQLGLDRLAVAFAEAPEGAYSEDAHAGSRDGHSSRKIIGARFPQLGLYRQAHPDLDDAGGEMLVGDGIDDLIDISDQMHMLLEQRDRVGPDAALRELHLLARHWLAHLRSLSGYLHHLRYEQP